jgi:hypothetical protein
MEHPTEHFGTVPPDQVPEAYAAGPLFSPTSETAGESGSALAADGGGALTLDVDDDRLAADADRELAFDMGDDPADADDELAFDANDRDDEPDPDAWDERAVDADEVGDGAHAPWPGLDDHVDAAGELPRVPDEELASIAAKRQATGEPRVDAALARLDDLAGLPVTEHRAVCEDVHRRLRGVLGDLDTGHLPEAGDAGAESRRGR